MQQLINAIIYALLTVVSAQYQSFVTRPNNTIVSISILQNSNPAALAPGYFFLTPLVNNGPAFGPQIFDNSGQLIYTGQLLVQNRANGATLCNYAGHPTLCFNDGMPLEQDGHSTGVNRFISSSYADIDHTHTYGALGGLRDPDNHEENTPDGTYVLQTVFQPTRVDLTSYSGDADGWILDACFQQVSIPDMTLQFQWCAYEAGIGLNETYIHMTQTGLTTNPVAGNGSEAKPWDPYHINSVAKDAVSGDYVVSLRHCNTLVRVCGVCGKMSAECAGSGMREGSIAWRLGGARSDFESDFSFSGQHMVRFHNGYLNNTRNTTLSIFNDASDGVTSTANHSSGQIFTLDFPSRSARLLAEYALPPQYTMLSVSQGSFQLLPNGNTLVGWGAQPYYSEFTQSGELLYHASFGQGVKGIQNYRAFKYPWTGTPQTRPDMVSYAGNCKGEVYGYVSWNGATEARSWVFQGSNETTGGAWRVLARVEKKGFETMTFLSGSMAGSAKYVRVEALGVDGRVIGVSEVEETFVPSDAIAQAWNCTALGCRRGTDYGSLAGQNVAGTC